MLQILYMIAIGLYLLSNIFTANISLTYLISIFSLLIILFTFLKASRFIQVFSLIFLILGSSMLFFSGTMNQFLLSFGPMLNLLSLFALVPILALPVKLGNYAVRVQQEIQKKIKKPGQLYVMTSTLSYFLSTFMNLATLPLAYHSIRPSLDTFPIQNKERFMSRAITHGFSMPLVWAPVTPIVGIVIDMNEVSWVGMLPYLIPLSLLGLILAWIVGLRVSAKSNKENSSEVEKTEESLTSPDEQSKKPGKLLHVLVAMALIFGLISLVEYLFDFSFLFLVSILVIPISLTWSLLIKEGKQFLFELKEHFRLHLVRMQDLFVIFLSAGFFISTIQFSGMNSAVNTVLINFIDIMGSNVFLVLLPLIPFALAFMGLHPAVSIALVAGVVNHEVLGVAPELLVIALLGGATTAFLMGPYNGTLGLMSGILRRSPFQVSNWNMPFTMVYLIMIFSVLVVLEYMSKLGVIFNS